MVLLKCLTCLFGKTIMKLMLEDKDIQKMIEVFATKEDLKSIITKDEFREAISGLHTAIDAYAKKVDAFAQEMIMLAQKLTATKNGFIKSLKNSG